MSIVSKLREELAHHMARVDDASLPLILRESHERSASFLMDKLSELIIVGHDAESHSRRSGQCRTCHEPIADHGHVNISDSLAVSWWTGTQYGQRIDRARVAMVKTRQRAAARMTA